MNYSQFARLYYPQQPTQIIQHVHYHYFVDDRLSTRSGQIPPQILKRVRSHGKITNLPRHSTDSQTESVCSKRSWKQEINPQYHFQKDIKNQAQTSNSTDSHIVQTKKKPKSHKGQYINSTIINQNKTKQFQAEDRIGSSILTNKKEFYQRQQELSFSEIPEQSKINDFGESSAILKKPRELNSSFTNPFASTQTIIQIGSSQHESYRNALLEQECNYLRVKFLQHYVERHPELLRRKQ